MDERYLPFYGGTIGGANQPALYANYNGFGNQFGGFGSGYGYPYGTFSGYVAGFGFPVHGGCCGIFGRPNNIGHGRPFSGFGFGSF